MIKSGSWPNPAFKMALMGLTVLSFFLRLHRLGLQSIRFDEALSALFASQPLDIAIQSMLQEGLHHSPLYYISLRPFMAGDFSEFGVRYLSAVLGVVAIPLIGQLGRTLLNKKVGFLASVLFMSGIHKRPVCIPY